VRAGSSDRGNGHGTSATRAVAALVCLVLVVAGCGGQGTAASTSGSGTTAGAGSPGAIFNVCSLVAKADVSAAYGGDVADGTQGERSPGTPDGTTCHFKVAGAARAGKPMTGIDVPEVIVSLRPGMYNSTADQQKLFPGDQVKPVAGIGEEAWSMGGDLNVKHGTDSLSVTNVGFTGYDIAELAADAIALARIVYPRL
jgi:hypothetical protein